MKDSASEIMVGTVGERVCVKIAGKGTHLNSPSLREFLCEMMDTGYRRFRIDLNDCTYMDSTFLGTLVGLSMRLKPLTPEKIGITRINARNLELLQTLGIEQFFHVENNSTPPPCAGQELQALPEQKASVEAKAETMLAAHEALADADERNVCRFKDVISFLKDDLERIKAAKAASASSSPSDPKRG